eukprot:TRINITY_DN11303_c0_g1_i1.p1 TRINITY_DN11303_c0_g1~~TRINITY_DN11303_c0_g1_i1.p1  ORF type:complete len:570 (+),score=89.18 TRINITY_DN11303_c0_g1_i1:20-1729(+)
MQEFAKEYIAARPWFNGVCCVASGADKILELAHGFRKVADHASPLVFEDRFFIASITKQITAALVLRAVDAGLVDLDKPVAAFIPKNLRLHFAHSVTVRQVLLHTAGILSYTSLPQYQKIKATRYSPRELLALIGDSQPLFTPGTHFQYSNSGFALLGVILEHIHEKSAHEIFAQLFDEIGMKDSYLAHDATSAEIWTRPASEGGAVPGHAYRGVSIVTADAIDLSVPYTAGSVVSTVADLATWTQALFEGRVVSSGSLALMKTPSGVPPFSVEELPESLRVPSLYGMGVIVEHFADGRTAFYHTGGFEGYQSVAYYCPSSRHSIVVLSNVISDVVALARGLVHLSLALPPPIFAPLRDDLAPALVDQYVSIYRNIGSGALLRIDRDTDSGRLFLRAVGTPVCSPLFPITGERFCAVALGEVEFKEPGVLRLLWSSGKVEELRVESDEERLEDAEAEQRQYLRGPLLVPCGPRHSRLLLDVKVWEEDTDWDEVVRLVKEIEISGVIAWTSRTLVRPTCLRLGLIVQDDKFNFERIEEAVEDDLSEYVQVIDIASAEDIKTQEELDSLLR